MTREDKLRKAIEEYIGYPCEIDEDINITQQRCAFADGANWQYQEFFEKAIKWLYENLEDDGYKCHKMLNFKRFIEDG